MTTAGDREIPAFTRYSSDDLPARDRFAVWREVVGPTFLRLDVSRVADHPFRARGVLCTLPGLGVQWADNSGIRMDRTRGLVSDGSDDLILPLVTEGRHFASQRGRESVLDEGETALLSSGDIGSVGCAARSRAIVLRCRASPLRRSCPASTTSSASRSHGRRRHWRSSPAMWICCAMRWAARRNSASQLRTSTT